MLSGKHGSPYVHVRNFSEQKMTRYREGEAAVAAVPEMAAAADGGVQWMDWEGLEAAAPRAADGLCWRAMGACPSELLGL